MVLAGDSDRARLTDAIRASAVLAVDTEFHAERRYLPRLHLVQLGTDDGTIWLVDPHAGSLLRDLAEPLRSLPWVLHGGAQDIRILGAALGGVPDRVWDTQIAAGLTSSTWPASYSALVLEHLGVELEKAATLTDWSRRPLTAAQIHYAAEDVTRLRPLWDRLWTAAGDLGRHEIVAAACDDARREALEPDAADLAWRQVPGASILTPQQAAVLQELTTWRELVAREEDQPARSVVADGILTEIARRQPATEAGLLENRRIAKGVVKRYGERILEHLERARSRPEWAWPRPVAEGSIPDRTAAMLYCLVQADAEERRYGARLLLPRLLREDVAVARPADREALAAILGSWRDRVVGDLLMRGLAGTVGVVLGPRGPTVHPVSPRGA